MNIWMIVLAAGEGSRLGGNKLTLPFLDSTIIETVVASALQVQPEGIIVVLGHHAPDVRAALSNSTVHFVTNPNPEQGMLSSVQCGIRALQVNTDAFFVLLGDQPQVDPQVLQVLISACERSGDGQAMFIPAFNRKRGHPVLFKIGIREEILALPLGVGLNAWRENNPDRVQLVEVETDGVLLDIDTAEDYRRALDNHSGADSGIRSFVDED